MIWIRKKEEVRISALLALLSIPISIPFYGILVHGGGSILNIIYIPVFIVAAVIDDYDLAVSNVFLIQYFGYFLFIYLSFKILRKYEIIREPGMTQEESEQADSEQGLNSEEKLFICISVALFILGLLLTGIITLLDGPSFLWGFYKIASIWVMMFGIILTIVARKRRSAFLKMLLANSWLVLHNTYHLIL